MDIPLLDQGSLHAAVRDRILHNRCVLFLGAGASKPAGGPLAAELRDEIALEFLKAAAPHEDLTTCIDIICSVPTVDQQDVRRYVAQRVDRLAPTEEHRCLAQFRWPAVFTTNYDRLVEKAFEREQESGADVSFQAFYPGKYMNPVDRDTVPIYKLFGCSSWLRDNDVPLILTSEDMMNYEDDRKRMLALLGDLNEHYTWLFAGYSFNDGIIRRLIEELKRELGPAATRWSYALLPSCPAPMRSYFQAQRILVIDQTFEDFFSRLCEDSKTVGIGTEARHEPGATGASYPLELTRAEVEAIDRQFEIVALVRDDEDADAKAFLSGNPPSWSNLRLEHDLRRDVVSALQAELEGVLDQGFESPYTALITGSAGSGKTTALRRLAYDLHMSGRPVIRVLEGARWTAETLEAFRDGLLRANPDQDATVCVAYDNVDRSPGDLRRLQTEMRSAGIRAVIIAAARPAPLNIAADEFSPDEDEAWPFHVDNLCELPEQLSHEEASSLLAKLEAITAVRIDVETPRSYWVDRFVDAREGGLLVILSELLDEAGRRFVPIVLEEYEQLESPLARAAYKFVSIAHRLNILLKGEHLRRTLGCQWWDFFAEVASRAEPTIDLSKLEALHVRPPRLVEQMDSDTWGKLIRSLVDGGVIQLTEDKPLEYWTRIPPEETRLARQTARLIVADYTSIGGEQLFRTRHAKIAETITVHVCEDTLEFGRLTAKLLASIRPGDPYEVRTARDLLRSRELMEQLSAGLTKHAADENRRLAFRAALSSIPKDLVLLQHFGIMEMNHGNYVEAETVLEAALRLDEDNAFIIHSLGLLYARWSSKQVGSVRNYYFTKSLEKYGRARDLTPQSEYPYIAWSEVLMRRAEDAGAQEDEEERLLRISEALAVVEEGMRAVPQEGQVRLPRQVAKLSELISDEGAAREVLVHVIERTHDPAAYRALAILEMSSGGTKQALRVLNEATARHQQHVGLLSLRAQLILETDPSQTGKAVDILGAVCAGSNRPDDHVLYGVGSYMLGRYARATKSFQTAKELAGVQRGEAVRRVRFEWKDATGEPRQFDGTVQERAEPGKVGRISSSSGYVVYVYGEGKNATLAEGDQVSYGIGFSLLGPRALSIRGSAGGRRTNAR